MNTDESAQSEKQSSLVLLLQDEYNGFTAVETMVIRDQKRLKSLYAKINRTRKPGLPVPNIDFSKEMVIVHCNGEQNYVGLPRLILNKETNTNVVLKSKTSKEKKNASIAIVTNPFCVYKMALTTKEIIVEKDIKYLII